MKSRLEIVKLCAGVGTLAALLVPGVLGVAKVNAQTVTATVDTRQPIIGGEAPKTPQTETEPTSFPQGPLFPYSLLDYALTGNVDPDGSVRYGNLKDNKNLRWFIKAVSTADLSQFPVFTFMEEDPATGRPTVERKNHTTELIFWINAYNGYIFDTIAKAYPIGSIDSIRDFDTAKTHNVAGKDYSFKEMREKILSFGDPRALFALTSGTWGGFLPSPTAVRYVEFDSRMNAAVNSFVNDPRNVSTNRIQNVVTVSSAFKDISDNFKATRRQKYEGIRYLLAGYTNGNARGYFSSGSYDIKFMKPDNKLNDRTQRGTNS